MIRKIRKFAILPVKIENKVIWLKEYYSIQDFVPTKSTGIMFNIKTNQDNNICIEIKKENI